MVWIVYREDGIKNILPNTLLAMKYEENKTLEGISKSRKEWYSTEKWWETGAKMKDESSSWVEKSTSKSNTEDSV